jgi:hypothetical protein
MAFKKNYIPWNKGKILAPLSDEIKAKISVSLKGRKYSEEHRNKLSLSKMGDKNPQRLLKNREKNRIAHLGKKCSPETIKKMRDSHPTGEKSPLWIKDRTKLSRISKQGDRRTSAYLFWRKSVWLRDNFKCKIANPNCNGRIEAHHILSWRDYPELRHDVNNGITLCHYHHPRKRVEEVSLVSYFQELLKTT